LVQKQRNLDIATMLSGLLCGLHQRLGDSNDDRHHGVTRDRISAVLS
jgi:hypothetical protein